MGPISDLRRFTNFEKTLCYQFPGLMNAPWAARKPGGPPTVNVYEDYRRYLKGDMPKRDVRHAALDKPAELAHPYAPVYSGSGDRALVDGLEAAPDHRDPNWQGYGRDDLVAAVDLGETIAVELLAASFLQKTAPGIFLPTVVEYWTSEDGKTFHLAARIPNTVRLRQRGPLVHRFTAKLHDVRARYIRMRAENVKAIPSWHQAAGGKAWLFADEIRVNP